MPYGTEYQKDSGTASEAIMTTILMTGASRGIGRRAAETMLAADPALRLLVVARGATVDHPRVTTVPGDLASLESVRKVVAAIDTPLDGFLGNAGLQMKTARTTTPDGLETTFAVNVLANYLLVTSLPFASPARVVITGSDVHFGDLRHRLFGIMPPPRWDTADRLARPNDQPGRGAYATSKLAVLYLVHALARHLPGDVDVYTFSPGFTPGTGLVRDDRIGDVLFRRVFPLLPGTNTVEAAGDQLAAAMTGPRPGPSGSYIDRTTVTRSSAESYDRAREDDLWATAARLTATA
jgi:NAD(P)-dependent dehydrogenase (short-subunit alcohol dehydrogenase family)